MRPVSARRRDDLSTPRSNRLVGVHYDPDAFGAFSEAIARTIGTARFLMLQTGIIVVWIVLNLPWTPSWLQFDPWDRGLVLLTLALSLQAAYAAPLILLAQTRQEDRDRAQGERDRDVSARTQADTEFLAREMASIRLALADVVTASELDDALARLTQAVERLERRLDSGSPDSGGSPDSSGSPGSGSSSAGSGGGAAHPVERPGR